MMWFPVPVRNVRQGPSKRRRPKERPEKKEEKQAPRQFVNFSFFKLDPAFRRLPQEQIDQGKKEFMEVLEEYDNRGDVILLSYTTMGIRADSEIMFWRVSHRMENFQEMTTKMYRTGLGKYLIQTYSYFSQTKRSMYMDIFNPEHEEDRTHIIPGKAKYLFIYPFTKKREWYLLTKFARQGIMDEHIFIGNKYPSVKLNTTYSFGIDDYEFVVAFETDSPDDFVDSGHGPERNRRQPVHGRRHPDFHLHRHVSGRCGEQSGNLIVELLSQLIKAVPCGAAFFIGRPA